MCWGKTECGKYFFPVIGLRYKTSDVGCKAFALDEKFCSEWGAGGGLCVGRFSFVSKKTRPSFCNHQCCFGGGVMVTRAVLSLWGGRCGGRDGFGWGVGFGPEVKNR